MPNQYLSKTSLNVFSNPKKKLYPYNQSIKWLIIGVLISSLPYASTAQSYSHFTMWSRVLVSKQFKKWSVSAEAAYRRQNNYHFSGANLFKNPLLDAQRITVAYRLKKWQFGFIPSRWHSYPLLGKEADFLRQPTVEIRFTPSVEFFQPVHKSTVQFRTQYDYRLLPDRTTGRIRFRFQYRYPVLKDDEILLGDEVLLGGPPNSTKSLEQNQLSLLYNHTFTKHLESELGYRYTFRNRRNSPEIDNENAVVIGMMFRL